MSIYGHKGPEDSLPEHWKVQERRINHRQGRLTGGDIKRLYEATSHILAMYADNDMCVCDGGDSSVGMPPTTCEAHMLALLVEDIIESQRPRKRARSALEVPMNLEPIRALLEQAEKATPGHACLSSAKGWNGMYCVSELEHPRTIGDFAKLEDAKHFVAARNSTAALSQLLEAVTNLEKLIAKLEADDAESARQYWANKERMQRGETIIMNVIVGTEGYFHNPVIDDLKRLLHPEDK